jgi:dTDP-4-dehydrorhamnose reductase
MHRILVTGASGLLGVNIAYEVSKQYQVIGVTNRLAYQNNEFDLITQDLLAPGAVEKLIDKVEPDWIIHCAALANLEACEANPEQARKLNSELPGKLAAIVARGGARLLHVSTDAVFDGVHGDYQETDQPNPLSVYAQSKLDGEYAVAEANPDAIIARVNLFGWSITGKRSLAEFFYNNLQDGKTVFGFTDVYFCPLLANHLANIFIKMLEANLSGLYHVVSSSSSSKYNFGVEIAQRFGFDATLITPTSVTQAGLKAARSPNLTLKNDRLKNALGTPLPDIMDGLGRFFTLHQEGYPQKLRKLCQTQE